jgi:hypothetical protein
MGILSLFDLKQPACFSHYKESSAVDCDACWFGLKCKKAKTQL